MAIYGITTRHLFGILFVLLAGSMFTIGKATGDLVFIVAAFLLLGIGNLLLLGKQTL